MEPMQIGIDYSRLGTATAIATKALRRRLEAASIGVIDIASDGKVRRSASVSYREVVINLRDNQTVALRVTQTGDVFQVLVNGKVTPIFAQGSPTEAINELALILDRTRAQHQKRLAALQVKPPPSIRTAAPKLEATLREQIAQVDAQIAEAREELAQLQAA